MLWYNNELVSMAKEIGYRLLPAFNTSTGIPYPRVSCAWLWNKIHVFVNYSIQWLNFWTNQEIRWSKIWSPLPENKVSSFLLLTEKLVWNVPSMCLFHSQNSGESMTKWFWAMDLKSSNREFKWCSDWHLDSFQVPCSTPLLHLYMAKCLLPNLLSSFEVVVTLRWFQRSLGKLVL